MVGSDGREKGEKETERRKGEREVREREKGEVENAAKKSNGYLMRRQAS